MGVERVNQNEDNILDDILNSNLAGDSVQAFGILREVFNENERLKDEIHEVIKAALQSYYELSKYQHRMLSEDDDLEEQINNKIDETMIELREI